MVNRTPNWVQPILCAVLALLVAASMARPHHSAAQDEGLAKANRQGFEQLQTRIAALNVSGIPLTDYHLAKAQAWLEFSKEEYFDNDRSGIVESTFAQAHKVIEQLEAGVTTPLELSTPLLEGEARLDPESWEVVENFKVQKLICAGNLIARLEVQLVQVEHEVHELGQIHAAPYRQAVQRMMEEIKAVDCSPPSYKGPVPQTEIVPEPKP